MNFSKSRFVAGPHWPRDVGDQLRPVQGQCRLHDTLSVKVNAPRLREPWLGCLAVGSFHEGLDLHQCGVTQFAARLQIANEVRIGGKLAYVGGGFAGYTETGNVGVIQVDPQIFGLLTAKLEVSDSMVLGKTAGGEVKGTATVALFAQTNVGGSSVPVTIYQNSGGAALGTSTVSAPTGTVFGTTASLDVKVPVSQQVDFTAGLNGALRSDGALGGGARVGLGGSF